MIQRIQSIYLALAAIFSVFPFFVPLVLFTDENKWISMNNVGYDGSQIAEMAGRHPYGLAVWGIVVVILPLISIFAFKNRKNNQMGELGHGCQHTLVCGTCCLCILGKVTNKHRSPFRDGVSIPSCVTNHSILGQESYQARRSIG